MTIICYLLRKLMILRKDEALSSKIYRCMLLSRLHLANVNVSSTATRSSQTWRWRKDGNGIDGDNPTQNSTSHISCFHTNLLASLLACLFASKFQCTLMLMLNRYEFVVSRDNLEQMCALIYAFISIAH